MTGAVLVGWLCANTASAEPAPDAFAEVKEAQRLLVNNDCEDVRKAQAAVAQARASANAAAAEKLAKLVEARIARTSVGLGCGAARRSSRPKLSVPPKPTRPLPERPLAPTCSAQSEAVIRYDEVKAVVKEDEATCAHAAAAEGGLCRTRLPLERREQAEAALEVLGVLPRFCSDWGRVRAELDLVVARAGRDAPALLDLLEQSVASRELTAEEVSGLLEEGRSRLELVALLSRPEAKESIGKFIEIVHKRFPNEKLEPLKNQDGVLDAATILAFFQRRSPQETKAVLADARDAGLWAPHWRRDELRTLIALEDGVGEEEIKQFVEGFRPWISAMSPLDARPEIVTDKLDHVAVVALLDHAAKALAGPKPCTFVPTPDQERTLAPAALEEWLLCGSYVGLLLVEVGNFVGTGTPAAPNPGTLVARASWRIHEDGQRIAGPDTMRSDEFQTTSGVPLEEAQRIGRRQADVGAKLGNGILERRERFARVAKLLMERERGRQLSPQPRPSPPSMASQVPLAFLFAGLPYWRDPQSPAAARWIFTGLDVAAVVLAGSFFGESISARNASAGRGLSDAEAAFDANRWRAAAGYTLLGLGVLRTAAAACYWIGWCR